MTRRGMLLVVFVSVALAVLVLTIAHRSRAQARELFPGQYAQVDPATRYWFRNQKSPKTGGNCCSEADGVYAEEDIRQGEYWVRFIAKLQDGSEVLVDWMPVPGEVVIHDPNRNGAPVVWWYWDQVWQIRCYAPGSGV